MPLFLVNNRGGFMIVSIFLISISGKQKSWGEKSELSDFEVFKCYLLTVYCMLDIPHGARDKIRNKIHTVTVLTF